MIEQNLCAITDFFTPDKQKSTMNISQKLFLSPKPKKCLLKEGHFSISCKTTQNKSAFSFNNSFLNKRLAVILGKTAAKENIEIICRPGTVEVPCNADQAYSLKVQPERIIIAGNTETGLLYALQTLSQLEISRRRFQCAEILDWPDQELRICARPLLCGEGNRSALAWGDGQRAEIKRWHNEIDFALRCRYNGIFVHGFTWNTKPYPGFARSMRALNKYARERGVTLIFGGYGIGKGGWGESAYISEAHNFLPGAGHKFQQNYPCSWNSIHDEKSAYNGTCRSNEELRKEKYLEIRDFLKEIQPGALYIHHEDQSEYDAESQPYFWDKRCPACRKKWPDDSLESMNGGAAAIADGYDVFGEARDAVKTEDYDAARDCRLILASPCYGTWYNSDEEWSRVEKLWVNIALSMKQHHNIYFVMREQFSDHGGEGRLQRLSRLLDEAGCEQKLMVFFVSGGALYGENAAFSSLPEMNSLTLGGNGAIFNFSGVLFQRPQQMYNSECSWNAYYRPDGETLSKDTFENTTKEYHRRMRQRDFIEKRHLDEDSYLARCCESIYGEKAGKDIFRYQTLRTPHGDGPLVLLYQQIVMEKLFKKLNSKPEPEANPGNLGRPVNSYEDTALRWEEQTQISRQGAKLISRARSSVKGWLGKELERQAAQLKIGVVFGELIGKIYRHLAGENSTRNELMTLLNKLRILMNRLPHDYARKEDGDGALYENHLEKLSEFINRLVP